MSSPTPTQDPAALEDRLRILATRPLHVPERDELTGQHVEMGAAAADARFDEALREGVEAVPTRIAGLLLAYAQIHGLPLTSDAAEYAAGQLVLRVADGSL